MNILTELIRKMRPGLRDAALKQHDEYTSGDLGRLMLFATEAGVVTVLLMMIVAAAASITFTPDGWANTIGQILADVCVSSRTCDLDVLLAGLASAVIIIIALIILTAISLEKSRTLIDAPNADLFDGLNDIADNTIRLREQNQTIMAMLFMIAPPATQERIAAMFADTLDDEESKQLRTLIEEAEAEREVLPEPPDTEETFNVD